MRKALSFFFLIFILVLLSRIPFLNAGYGADPDAWRVASAARSIAASGDYVASRLPGYPIVERIYACLGTQDPFILNGISALLSALGAGILFLIVSRYKVRRPLLFVLTYIFVPIVFVASTITMDYMWAMFFVLSSWYTGLNKNPLASGLLLALATGCRITSAALALPFALMFFERKSPKTSLLSILQYWLAVAIGSVVIYLPVYRRYGFKFFTYSSGSYPSLPIILKTAFVDVWGIVGAAVVVMLIVLAFMRRKNTYDARGPALSADRRIWLAVVLLYIIEFAALPDEAAYLIPIIPFVLLLIESSLPTRLYIAGCLLLISSSFLISVDSADRPWSPQLSKFSKSIKANGRTIMLDAAGPIFSDHAKRIQRLIFIEQVLQTGDTMDLPSVIVAGSWLPYIIQATPEALPESELPNYTLCRKNIQYIDLMNNDLLSRIQKKGVKIYYLSSVENYNWNVFGIDLKEEGAIELMPAKL